MKPKTRTRSSKHAQQAPAATAEVPAESPEVVPYEEEPEDLESWEERQNDPDNWLIIPEFGVRPQEVAFEGFRVPIVGPDINLAGWRVRVRDAVGAVRNEARRRFRSLREMKEARQHLIDKLAPGGISPKASADEIFAFHYDAFFWQLGRALYNSQHAPEISLLWLASAMETALYIRSKDRLGPELAQQLRAEQGREGARAKHDKDPKQAAKRAVKQKWAEWQESPSLYGGKKAGFARAMVELHPELKSTTSIERWCKAWAAELEAPTAPQLTNSKVTPTKN